MSSAGSGADPKLPLLKQSQGGELSRDVVENILNRLKSERRDLSHGVVEEILNEEKPLGLGRIDLSRDVVEEILKQLGLGKRAHPQDLVGEILKLPPDLVGEILKRILMQFPVKYLFQCRCFGKLWQATIDSSGFVDLHLKHAFNWHLACSDLPCSDLRSSLCIFSGESLSMSNMEVPFPTSGYYVLVGSCNGLICVAERSKKSRSTYLGSMYLWNPFTKQYKHVQPYEDESFSIRTSVGFGFHSKSKDYTIVMIDHQNEDMGKKKCGVKIYSLKTDSWRSLKSEVPGVDPGELWDLDVPKVYLNGTMYWFVPNRRPQSLLFFNLTKEVFDEMAISEEIFSGGGRVVALLVLKDLLVLCTVREEAAGQHSACSVWVKDRPESWTEWYTFSFNRRVRGFDGFMGNGDLLIVIDDYTRACWNPVNRQVTNLDEFNEQVTNLNLRWPWRRSNLFTVVESLVSLDSIQPRLKLQRLIRRLIRLRPHLSCFSLRS